MFGIFRKKQTIRGLTAEEVISMHDEIVSEIEEAKKRQVKPDMQPNQYMRGLYKALDILEDYRIHVIAEVR